MRFGLVASVATCAFLVGCSESESIDVESDASIDVPSIAKSVGAKCEGQVLAENRIPCLIASELVKNANSERTYKCLLVVHNRANVSASASLNSLSREGLIAWGAAANDNYELLKREITQIQEDFIVKDASNPMNLKRWEESCHAEYLLAERELRKVAFSEEAK